jgi:TolB-like protein/Tfp pilus assembly protein PilF
LRADLQRLKRDRESGRKAAAVASDPARPKSLAVLPFANLSADKENVYFSDGLAEEIINALSRLPGLRTIARTSSFSFRGKEVDVRRIGATLNVEHILEGSVRKAGNRIRVTAQLVGTADGSHQWSERYDREMTDAFAIQDEICEAIVDKLRVELAPGRPLVKRHTENIEAYNLFLQGRHHFWKMTPDGATKSKEYYERAIGVDPNYALAWYGLAYFYHYLGFLGGVPPKVANARALPAALKALELDDTLAEAHALMGGLRAVEFDWKGAEREFRRAVELDPRSVDVWLNYNFFYQIPTGRLDEAIAAARTTVDLDPLSAFARARLGHWLALRGQHERGIEQCRQALEVDPHCWTAHLVLAHLDVRAGKFGEAIRTYETVAQATGRSPIYLGLLGQAYAVAGRVGDARAVLAELQDLARRAYVPPTCFGGIHGALGETDRAFDDYDQAVDSSDPLILDFQVSPSSDSLRSHPRYQALLRKMNLEL